MACKPRHGALKNGASADTGRTCGRPTHTHNSVRCRGCRRPFQWFAAAAGLSAAAAGWSAARRLAAAAGQLAAVAWQPAVAKELVRRRPQSHLRWGPAADSAWGRRAREVRPRQSATLGGGQPQLIDLCSEHRRWGARWLKGVHPVSLYTNIPTTQLPVFCTHHCIIVLALCHYCTTVLLLYVHKQELVCTTMYH